MLIKRRGPGFQFTLGNDGLGGQIDMKKQLTLK